MGILKNSFLKISGWTPMPLLKVISPIDVYLPYHHLVSNADAPHIRHLYQFKNVGQFEKDLDFLLKHFSPASVEDVVAYAKGERAILRNQFLLTFDDGFQECASIIAPLLIKKGVPAIFFLNNDFIDNKKLFYRLKISLLIEQLVNQQDQFLEYQNLLGSGNGSITELLARLKKINQKEEYILDTLAARLDLDFEKFLSEQQPFLTTEAIEGLVKQGFAIGGHSLSHPYFHLLTDAQQVEQAVSSTKQLAERFRQKHLLFSFPHSDKEIKETVLRQILSEGIDVLFGIQNQLPELGNNMLHRFNAERPSVPVRRQLKAVMVHAAMSKMFGKFHVNRK